MEVPASFFAIEPESSSLNVCFGRSCAYLETTSCLKRRLSWLSAHYGNVVKVIRVIVEEREHARKHLGVLGFETVSNNP